MGKDDFIFKTKNEKKSHEIIEHTIRIPFVCAKDPMELRNEGVSGIIPFLVDPANSAVNFSTLAVQAGLAYDVDFSICRDLTQGQYLVGSDIFSERYENRSQYSGVYTIEEEIVNMGQAKVFIENESLTRTLSFKLDFTTPNLTLPDKLYETFLSVLKKACDQSPCPRRFMKSGLQCFDNSAFNIAADWADNLPIFSLSIGGHKILIDAHQYSTLIDKELCLRVFPHKDGDSIVMGWTGLLERTVSFNPAAKRVAIHSMGCNDLLLMYNEWARVDGADLDLIIIMVWSLAGVLLVVIIVSLVWATVSYYKGVRADLKKLKEDPNNPVISKVSEQEKKRIARMKKIAAEMAQMQRDAEGISESDSSDSDSSEDGHEDGSPRPNKKKSKKPKVGGAVDEKVEK
jgi:hypothetical protein